MKRETTTGPTPGPWTAEGAPGTTLTIKGPDGFPVFRIRGGMLPVDADARLIASAPDLYAALREVQRALACDRDGIPYAHPVHGRITLEEVKYTVVDPALSRAEGKGGAR